jgi:hypothetical protein
MLISVSAAALIAGAGLAIAQDKSGPSGGGGPSGASPQQSAPPSSQPGGGGAMKGGGEKGTTGQGGQMEQRQEAPPPRAQQKMDRGDQPSRDQKGQAQDKKGGAGTTGQGGQMEQRGQDTPRAQDRRGQETPRAQDRNQQRQDRQDRAQDKSAPKGGATTGQGAAGSGGASLTTEQRTKISTTIRQSNVQPVRNVNFNISVGTVVPRTVTLHALPATVIEVYPQWRGYRFILVEDEIIIIEPSSYKIVAVIEA